MNKQRLYDALESCLQALGRDSNIDSALAKYPDIASTLRPLLEASLQAQTHAALTVPDQAFSHGRVKLLKRLAEMQNEHLCWRMPSPLPSIIHSFKHNWNSIRLPLFINRLINPAPENPVKKDSLQRKKNDEEPKENDQIPTQHP